MYALCCVHRVTGLKRYFRGNDGKLKLYLYKEEAGNDLKSWENSLGDMYNCYVTIEHFHG